MFGKDKYPIYGFIYETLVDGKKEYFIPDPTGDTGLILRNRDAAIDLVGQMYNSAGWVPGVAIFLLSDLNRE